MVETLPERFGRYQLLERIALGGMAEILLANSASLGGVERTCVIKRILPQFSRNPTFVSMFIDEARITIGLDHKNIVRLYDFGQHEQRYYMAIEYVDGTDLSQVMRAHLEKGRGVPPATAVFLARELLQGLHHAHSMRDPGGKPLGIVHRDVSPQNVLLSARGAVKLADFGIAAARHKMTLTSPGTVLGKAAYMSPEQATGKQVDFSADVWSVGVILHEMLAGERLFAAETPLATLQRVVYSTIDSPSTLRAGVPTALDRIVLKALERNPRGRYSSALAMASELDAWLREHAVRNEAFTEESLARVLSELEWANDTQQMRPARAPTRTGEPNRTLAGEDRRLRQLLAELRAEPDLWTLLAVGDRLHELGRTSEAISAWRTAAALFAHRGLLVQAVCAYQSARHVVATEEAEKDLLELGELTAGSRDELVELLAHFDRHDFWGLMQESDPDGLGSQPERALLSMGTVPLLGSLGPLEFARLALLARVRRVHPSELVIREGEAGDSLFAVGRGRLVVWTRPENNSSQEAASSLDEFDEYTSVDPSARPSAPGDAGQGSRVYLAGLADGDFFGEFSFLAERPRSATVEAVTESVLLEIDRAALSEIIRDDPHFTEPLLQFYKERVVDLLMAKSPVFSLLEPHDRRRLLDEAALVDFKDEEIIVEEGTLNDHLYFIKRGEVEIFRRDRLGTPIFINKLGHGQFFGEIAALKGTPRMVSVRAMGEVSLFRIDRAALLRIVDRQPRVKNLLDATIALRTAEMRARIREHQCLFVST